MTSFVVLLTEDGPNLLKLTSISLKSSCHSISQFSVCFQSVIGSCLNEEVDFVLSVILSHLRIN